MRPFAKLLWTLAGKLQFVTVLLNWPRLVVFVLLVPLVRLPQLPVWTYTSYTPGAHAP